MKRKNSSESNHMEERRRLRPSDWVAIIQLIMTLGGAVIAYFMFVAKVDASSQWIEESGKPYMRDHLKIIREEIDRNIQPIRSQIDRIESKLDKLIERRR